MPATPVSGIVYAAWPELKIWGDRGRIHGLGRVPLGEPLTLIASYEGWYRIERPAHISLPANPLYPEYWVPIDETSSRPPPGSPGATTDEEVAEAIASAIVMTIRWARALRGGE